MKFDLFWFVIVDVQMWKWISSIVKLDLVLNLKEGTIKNPSSFDYLDQGGGGKVWLTTNYLGIF